MARRPEKYLYDIRDCCKFLVEPTANETIERYKSDRIFRDAVDRELQIIGEAMMQLKALNPTMAEKMTEHDRIIGFRHVIVHGYDILDPNAVWRVVEEKLSLLHDEADALLRASDYQL